MPETGRVLERAFQNFELVGDGEQKMVFVHPDDPSKVVAKYYDSIYVEKPTVEELKKRFYLNKLLHLLFPQNIPDIHFASGNPPTMVIDRIVGRPTSYRSTQSISGMESLKNKLRRLGIIIDPNIDNFIDTEDGSTTMYVDGFLVAENYEREVVENAINEKLRGRDNKRALRYLDQVDKYEEVDILS